MLSKSGVRDLQRYSRKKHRVAEGRLLVEGWRSLEAALKAGVDIEWLLIAEGINEDEVPPRLMDRFESSAKRVDRIPATQFKLVSTSVTPSGLLAKVPWSPIGPEKLLEQIESSDRSAAELNSQPQIVVVADGVAEPGNLGAIIRTADWFGVSGVYAGPGSVEPTNPKVVQATMGSLFQVPVGSGASTTAFLGGLKTQGFSMVSLELGVATDLRNVDWPNRLVVVVGNEARGVSSEVTSLADERVTIPRFGRAESLNVAASVAVLLGNIILR